MQYITHTNKRIMLGSQLGSGGEATVYQLHHDPQLVAKVYHAGKRPPEEKLRLMVANPPDDPARVQNHVSIAWMTDLLLDGAKQPVGYVMPKITGGIPIHRLYHPKTRRDNFMGFTWQYLHRTARNLAAAVAAIHAKGYVIGDLNESNLLVQPTALVSLVDTDSFQVRNPQGKMFRCRVGKPEYIAPEIQGRDLSTLDRTQEHDCFALTVMIFLLLMEGSHPFRGSGDPPELATRIQRGLFPFGQGKKTGVLPPPLSLPLDVLYPEIQQQFYLCFVEGHTNPHRRPRASDWVHVLKNAEAELTQCSKNKHHSYLRTQTRCTWCERTKHLQGKDPFPDQASSSLLFLTQHPLPPSSSQAGTSAPPSPKLVALFTFLQAYLPPKMYHNLVQAITAIDTFPRSKKALGILSGLSLLGLIVAILGGGTFFVYLFLGCGLGAAGYFYYWRKIHWKIMYLKTTLASRINFWVTTKTANFKGSPKVLATLGGLSGLGLLAGFAGAGGGFLLFLALGSATYGYWKIKSR